MLDAVERKLLEPTAPGFTMYDHYMARVLDLLDLLGTACRFAVR